MDPERDYCFQQAAPKYTTIGRSHQQIVIQTSFRFEQDHELHPKSVSTHVRPDSPLDASVGMALDLGWTAAQRFSASSATRTRCLTTILSLLAPRVGQTVGASRDPKLRQAIRSKQDPSKQYVSLSLSIMSPISIGCHLATFCLSQAEQTVQAIISMHTCSKPTLNIEMGLVTLLLGFIFRRP